MNRGMLCGHTEAANREEGLEAGRQGRRALQLGNELVIGEPRPSSPFPHRS